MITKAVGSFKFIMRDLCEEDRLTSEKSQHARVRDSVHHLVGAKFYARFENDGINLHKSTISRKTLFPKRAARLHSGS